MLLPCEIVVKQYLPAVRASVAKQLAKQYGMNQRQIAVCLGLTQPAVNKYIAGKYGKEIKKFEREKQVSKLAEELAGKAVKRSGAGARVFVIQGICRSCKELRSKGPVCVLHKESVPLAEKCVLCMR